LSGGNSLEVRSRILRLEQIAPDWNREAIQGRVNLLGKTSLLEQIAPDWNREAIQGRVNLLGKTRLECVQSE
jgi:hypothetical protein